MIRVAVAGVKVPLLLPRGAGVKLVQIVDVEDVPLSYLPGNATRVRVKAVGDLTLVG